MWSWKKKSEVDPNDPDRDWRMMESIVGDAFNEQKKARRWGVVFKLLTFAYLFVLLLLFSTRGVLGGGVSLPTEPHVAVVRVEGMIAADSAASGGRINEGLRNAFENEFSKAVVLAINSPGGSPVQAGYVYDEIFRLKGEHPDKKIYAVISDLGASGGYYIAAAADEIYANRASLVGSIGVTASGFGFVETLEKLGIERRHFSAGTHKAFLDPFAPLKADERQFWEQVLDSVHTQFIDAVAQGRGERLEITDDIVSGLIWNGEQALSLGLIDGLASIRDVARDIVGEEALRDYTPRVSPFKVFLDEFGVSIGKGLGQSLDVGHVPGLR